MTKVKMWSKTDQSDVINPLSNLTSALVNDLSSPYHFSHHKHFNEPISRFKQIRY